MKKNSQASKTTHSARSKVKPRQANGKKASSGVTLKDKMLSVIARGRGETLGEALERVQLSATLYYYYLRRADFGADGRRRGSKVVLSSTQAKTLSRLVQKQQRLQKTLEDFTKQVL